MKQLGQKIAEIRKRKGQSQEALSEQAGISLRTLQRIEKGESEPRGHTLKSVCQALHVDVEEIYNYSKEADKSVLLLLHMSALSFLLIPLSNIILPLIIWITQKRKVLHVHEQGIALLNFQLTWSLIAYPTIVVFLLLKILHYPGANYGFTVYLILYGLNALYIARALLLTYRNTKRSLYPFAFGILKS